MERLTKKNDGSGSYTQFGDKYIPNHNIRHKQCVEKLGKLEDIEEELGIPLEVLLKALKDGIWTKGGNYDPCFLDATPQFIKNLDLHIGYCGYSQYDSEEFDNYFGENDALCIFTMDYEEHNYVTRLKDYGVTWALTKEELE